MLRTSFIRYAITSIFILLFILTRGTFSPAKAQSNIPAELQHQLKSLKRENYFDEALRLIETFLDTLQDQDNYRKEFEATLMMADIHRMKGQFQQSEYLLDSMRTSQTMRLISQEYDPLLAQFHVVQGTLHLTRGELKKGHSSIEKAVRIYSGRIGQEDTLLAPCYNKLGNYYFFTKNFDSAMYWYKRALNICDKKKDALEDRSSYLQNIGIIHLENFEYQQAETYFLESLRLKEILFSSNSFSLGRLYLNLGKFYQDISALDKALIYITKAEKIYLLNKNPASLELASIYWNKGLIYYLTGDSESAITFLFNAKQIIDSVFSENQNLLASLNSDIANVYRYTGQYDKAIDYYRKSMLGADLVLKIKTLRNLAYLYHLEGDLVKADYYFDQVLATMKTGSDNYNPDKGHAFLHYGYYLLDKGSDSAIFYLNHAFSLFNAGKGFHDREVAATLYTIGDYYLKKNDLSNALNYYQKSLVAISATFNDTNIMSNPELEILDPDVRAVNALNKKADCAYRMYHDSHDVQYLILSTKTYALCVDLIEQVRQMIKAEESQMHLLKSLHQTYNQAIENCLLTYEVTGEKEWLTKAFEFSERGKSMVLLKELKDAHAKEMGLIPSELTTLEKEIKRNIYLYRNNIWEEENKDVPDEKKLVFLRSNLLVYERKSDSLKSSLENNFKDYDKFKYDPSVVTVKQLQHILDQDEVILEYTLGDKFNYIFLISPYQFIVKKTIKNESLEADIFALRDNLDFNHVSEYNFQDFMEFQLTAFKLYARLIKPVEDYLTDKRIIIIPDGELNYLSFESLVQSITWTNSISFRNLPYLIKVCPVSYAPSGTIFALENKGHSPSLDKGVLALAPSTSMITRTFLANNQLLAEQLKNDLDLPGATWEADNILKIIKGKKLVGEEATEAEFKNLASSFDILHFATHTHIDNKNPLYSKLAFYPYAGFHEDGVLHTYEIYNLQLKGELAVLSACSTGSGKLEQGEGVISLARAFTYAGIPSVVMTLWDVEDVSTGNIVPAFYYLLREGFEKDVALRQSKLRYLEMTKSEIETHPAFWSGFVLYGNNRGFRQKSDNILTISLVILGGLIILFSFVIIRKYILYRKKLNLVGISLPTEFQPKDGL